MGVVISGIVPQPRVDVRSLDAESGSPVRVTTYRGVVSLDFERTGRIVMTTVPDTNPISFFLPDSIAYPPGADGVVSVALGVTLQPISGGDRSDPGPYGVHSASGALVDDPGGSPVRWVQLGFVNTYATLHTEVTYTATVVVPADDPA